MLSCSFRPSSSKKAKVEKKVVKKEPASRKRSTGSAAKVRLLHITLSSSHLLFSCCFYRGGGFNDGIVSFKVFLLKSKAAVKNEPVSPTKKKTKRELAKEQEQKEVWKWWEEDRKTDGVKWKFLEHHGPVFAPPYERLPSHVKLIYDGVFD